MTTTPEMKAIITIVFPKIKDKWRFVAYFMDYKYPDIQKFEKDANDPENSCLKLFEDWLHTDRGATPKTWDTLIQRIKAVNGLQQAAEKIEKEVNTLSTHN